MLRMELKQNDGFHAKHPTVRPSSAESNISRPSTGLARGVQITEYQDARSNPEPARIDESVNLLEGYLAPQKLRALTGVDDLEKVHFLEMKVDSRETSLGNFGMHLQNLTQLKLSNSIIISMRDLGSSLNNLRILWMARCGTEDLDGVSAMVNLRELYMAYNEISDLSPCGMLENLQILDIEGNNISDISQLTFLMLCQKLSSLTLEGNPVCVAASSSEADPEYNYRQMVKRLIPHLGTLDDEALLEAEMIEARSAPSVFDEDWKLLDELMAECPITLLDESLETGGRPGTSSRPQTGTAYRPGSALKPYSASGIRPGSSQAGRSAGGRPGSSCSGTGSTGSGNSHSTQPDGDDDPSCELTSGSIVCGSLSRALRNRRQKPNDVTAKQTEQLLSKFGHKPEHTFDTQLEDDETIRQLSVELLQWKEGHRRRVEEIEKTKAPQILKIEYDEASDASSDADSDDLSGAEGDSMGRMEPTDGYTGASDADKLFTRHLPPTRTEQRTRIYSPRRIDSGIGSLQSLQSAHQTQDESVDVEDDEPEPFDSPTGSLYLSRSFSSTLPGSEDRQSYGGLSGIYGPTPPSSMTRKYTEPLRPISGPVVTARRKYRIEQPQVDKTQPKVIDPVHPVIRSSVQSPEGRVSDAPRAGTSRAALAHPPTTPPALVASQLRRGLLSSVPLLPSKYNK